MVEDPPNEVVGCVDGAPKGEIPFGVPFCVAWVVPEKLLNGFEIALVAGASILLVEVVKTEGLPKGLLLLGLNVSAG